MAPGVRLPPCHSRESGNPFASQRSWTPACAGVTKGAYPLVTLFDALTIPEAMLAYLAGAALMR